MIYQIEQNTLDAMVHLEDGTAFNRIAEGSTQAVSGVLGQINSTIASIGSVVNAVEPTLVAKVTAAGATVTSVSSNISQFGAHVTDVYDNMADRISTFSSHQGLINAIEGKPISCNQMQDFFGSVMQEGNDIISLINSSASDLFQTINDFKALTQDLQNVVADTQSQIENLISNEISLTADPNRITQLTNILTAFQTQFGSETADGRRSIIDTLSGVFSTNQMQTINGIAGPMESLDFDILAAANKSEIQANGLLESSGGLSSIISRESNLIDTAVAKLVKFAQASSIRSMFKGDPCVNTLMGYVGTTGFLSKLI